MTETSIHPVKAFLVKIARKVIPLHLLQLYSEWRHPGSVLIIRGKPPEKVFHEIYKRNYWQGKDSVSGNGSDLDQTAVLVAELGAFLRKRQVTELLDIPCGDFNWMQYVDLTGIRYTGADIIQELVEQNTAKFLERKDVSFRYLNLLHSTLPQHDLILNRDCLVHFSFSDGLTALRNMQSSGSKYLLTTTYTDHLLNQDIYTGDWRRLNLEKPPFSFPPPLELIIEKCTEDHGAYPDKALGLWLLQDLILPEE